MGIQHEEDVEHTQFVVDSEPPHANLYSYNGVLRYWAKGDTPGREHPIVEHAQLGERQEKQEAITINELLLRGCAIRNTTWVIGLVVYTGADTKIMLNQGKHHLVNRYCSSPQGYQAKPLQREARLRKKPTSMLLPTL
jgi:phospholipid-translocating ATPase